MQSCIVPPDKKLARTGASAYYCLGHWPASAFGLLPPLCSSSACSSSVSSSCSSLSFPSSSVSSWPSSLAAVVLSCCVFYSFIYVFISSCWQLKALCLPLTLPLLLLSRSLVALRLAAAFDSSPSSSAKCHELCLPQTRGKTLCLNRLSRSRDRDRVGVPVAVAVAVVVVDVDVDVDDVFYLQRRLAAISSPLRLCAQISIYVCVCVAMGAPKLLLLLSRCCCWHNHCQQAAIVYPRTRTPQRRQQPQWKLGDA